MRNGNRFVVFAREWGQFVADEMRSNGETNANEMREFIRLLYKQKWLILGVTLIALVGTAFYTLGMPKAYEATTSLEYDPSPPRPLGREVEDVATPAGNFFLAKEWYQTQNKVLASRTVARRVVDRLALYRDPAFMRVPAEQRQNWQGTDRESATRLLMGQVSVRQERDTRVVRVTVESDDPQKAALIANAIADSYISWLMEERLGSTVRAVEWLSGQLDQLTSQLETSERGLHDFRRAHNVLSTLNEQQDVIAQTIQIYSKSLAEATTQRIAATARLHQLEQAYKDAPMEVHATLVSQSEAIAELKKQYQATSAERDALATKYGVNHPEILQVQAKLDGIVAATRTEIRGLVEALRGDVRESEEIEREIAQERSKAERVGLELNLHEIEYNRLERERANNEKLHGVLLQRTAETNLTSMLRVSPVRVVDQAVVPLAPIRPRMSFNLLLAGTFGFLAGLALALLRSRLDRSVRSPQDVAAAGATVLGLLPAIESDRSVPGPRTPRRRAGQAGVSSSSAYRDLIVHTHPRSAVAECCRTVRTNLAFMSTDKPLRSLLVTSPGPSEGKSTVAISLAITLAKGGKRVLLADTDLRRPRLHQSFRKSLRLGITSVLANAASLDECVQETGVENLWVLPCGPIPPNPAELLHTSSFAKLREDLGKQFDFVIFDSPPVGVVTDAAVLGPQVDGVVFVVRGGKTTRDALGHTLRQMRDIRANVLGCIVNEADISDRGGYGEYYYGSYGYQSNELPDNDGSGNPPSAQSQVAE